MILTCSERLNNDLAGVGFGESYLLLDNGATELPAPKEKDALPMVTLSPLWLLWGRRFDAFLCGSDTVVAQ